MTYKFRPTFAATVSMLVAFAILVGLGTWQVQRLSWKTDLLDRIEDRVSGEPAALPSEITEAEADDWDYRPVTLTGRFQHDRELHLVARTRDGRTGIHVVTPLVRPDGTDVLVNRGWVPVDDRAQSARPDGLPEGELTMTAIARVPEAQVWMQPDNDPQRNDWFWPDLQTMAEVADIGDPGPLIFEVADSPAMPPDAYPVAGQTRIDIPNNHLEYALTWYSLALTMIGVYIAMFLRREPGKDDPETVPEKNR